MNLNIKKLDQMKNLKRYHLSQMKRSITVYKILNYDKLCKKKDEKKVLSLDHLEHFKRYDKKPKMSKLRELKFHVAKYLLFLFRLINFSLIILT